MRPKIVVPYSSYSSYDAAVSASSPTHWWKLGDAVGSSSAVDTGGTSATVSGTITFGQAGIPGSVDGAANFATNAAATQSTTDYASPTTSVTIEAWIKTTSTVSGAGTFHQPNAPIVTFNDGVGDYAYEIGLNGGKIRAYSYPGFFDSSATVNDGAWHYIVLVIDGTGFGKLYIDNRLDTSGSLGNLPYTGHWTIGASPSGSGYSGVIGEVAVYEGVRLSPIQISNHYTAGLLVGNFAYAPTKPRRHPRRAPRHRSTVKVTPRSVASTPPAPVPNKARMLRRNPSSTRRSARNIRTVPVYRGIVAVLDTTQLAAGAATQFTPTFSPTYNSDYVAFVVALKPLS